MLASASQRTPVKALGLLRSAARATRMQAAPVSLLLLMASFPDVVFFNEIAAKSGDYIAQGGRLMVPLPDVRITFYPTSDDVL